MGSVPYFLPERKKDLLFLDKKPEAVFDMLVTSTAEVPAPCVSYFILVFLDQIPDEMQFGIAGNSGDHTYVTIAFTSPLPIVGEGQGEGDIQSDKVE